MSGARTPPARRAITTRMRARVALGVALASASLALASQPGGAPEAGEAAVPSALASRSLLLDAVRAGDRVVAVGTRGHVLLSDDDGVTWRQAAHVPTRATLTGVTFVDARRGWAVGHDATVIATDDGGERWRVQHRDPGAGGPLFSVWVDASGRGVAVGAYGLAIETDDGGATWRRSRVGGPEEDWHLNELFEAGDGALWIAAERGRTYRSVDGGRRWEPRPSDYAGSFWGGLSLSSGRLLVFGMRGNAFASDDGGATWRPLPKISKHSLAAAVELASDDVVIAGLGGSLLVSRDGGERFEASILPERRGANAALALAHDPGGLLLFGEGGVRRLETAELRALVAEGR